MKNLISTRVNGFNYENRFKDFYNLSSAIKPLLDFSIGQDTQLVTSDMKAILKAYLDDNYNYRYSENYCPNLKEAFRAFASKEYGFELQEEEVNATMGIKEVLNHIAYLLINPHDLVVVTSPGYNVFKRAATYYRADIIDMKLSSDNDYQPNITKYLLDNKLKPKIVQLNYPNNPTGRSVNYSYYSDLINYLSTYGGILINDAAYIDYNYLRIKASPLAINKKNVLELYSASKTFGLTGARVGMVAGDKTLIKNLEDIRDQFNSGPSLPYMLLYKDLLLRGDLKNNLIKYRVRYEAIKPILEEFGFEVPPLDSTFYLFLEVPSYLKNKFITAQNLANSLKRDHGIVVIPYDLDGSAYIRFSLTYQDDNDIFVLKKRLYDLRKGI